MNICPSLRRFTGLLSCCPVLCCLVSCCLVFSGACRAADADEIAALRRAVDALRAENRALAERLSTLEAQKRSPPEPAAAPTDERRREQLERRVKELETAQTAQEDAVRSIIRDSVSTLGSKINEAVSLSGTIEVTAERTTDFEGQRKSSIGLGTADFEFDIQTEDWARAVVRLEYLNGQDVLFPTSGGFQSGVDRINLDTAFIELGDARRFPPVLTAGRMVLPFGISTGRPLADVLSVNSPLTVEVFEMRQDAIGLSLAFPTPVPAPPTPPVTAPPVRPLVLQPLIGALAKRLGYDPPPSRPRPLAPMTLSPESPPFNVGVYVFDGAASGGLRRHYGASLGYHTKGHCGKAYEELGAGGLCPWGLSIGLDYNSSIFSSRLLQAEYQGLLDRIGAVPGAAASVKASLGAFALVGEWNGATRQARFDDDQGAVVGIRPAAWQAAIGYQFGWNPWVQDIGAQGTYVAIGYSESRDLAGLTRTAGGVSTRFGFVPRRRLLLTAGEWVMDGVRVAIEYSRNWDYSILEGGTGQMANGVFTTLTYAW